MKKLIILFLITGLSLSAVSRTLIYSWDFTTDGNCEGWYDFDGRIASNGTHCVANDFLSYTINRTPSPQWRIESADIPVILDAMQNYTFEIKLRQTSNTLPARTKFWINNTVQAGNEVILNAGSDWQIIEFDYPVSNRVARFSFLRFDPAGGQNGSWDIDYIRIYSGPAVSEKSGMLFQIISSEQKFKPVNLSELPDDVDRVDIFLLMGQSNMKGRGIIPDVQDDDIRIVNMNMTDNLWYIARHPLHKAGVPDLMDQSDNAGVGPGLDFAGKLTERDPNVRVALVPCAVGGSWIDLWAQGQSLYMNAVSRAKKALRDAPEGKGRICGILWMQGESDAVERLYATYGGKLSALIRNIRSDLNEPELPFFAATIGLKGITNTNNYPYIDELNEVLLNLPNVEPYTYCVDIRDVVGHIGDGAHLNTESQRIVGNRFAETYIQMQFNAE